MSDIDIRHRMYCRSCEMEVVGRNPDCSELLQHSWETGHLLSVEMIFTLPDGTVEYMPERSDRERALCDARGIISEPLAAIDGYADLALQGLPHPEGMERIRRTVAHIREQLDAEIEDARPARAETGAPPEEREP